MFSVAIQKARTEGSPMMATMWRVVAPDIRGICSSGELGGDAHIDWLLLCFLHPQMHTVRGTGDTEPCKQTNKDHEITNTNKVEKRNK